MRSVFIISSDKGLHLRPRTPLNERREQPLSTLFENSTLCEVDCVRMTGHSETINLTRSNLTSDSSEVPFEEVTVPPCDHLAV
jgi:hypothetical protein